RRNTDLTNCSMVAVFPRVSLDTPPRHCGLPEFKTVKPPLCSLLLIALAPTASAEILEIHVVDNSGRPVPCRVHLTDAAGNAQRAGKLPFWRDHFVCPGSAELELRPGKYDYEIERGPEYRRAAGSVEISGGVKQVSVTLERIADLAARGWWSGEL